MKKLLNVLFFGLLILVVAACSKPSSSPNETSSEDQNTKTESNEVSELTPEEGAELVLWDNGGVEGEWANYVAEEFTKKYGIPVTVEEVSHIDAPGKLETDGPAGLGADVFHAPHDHVGNMSSAGLIYDNYFVDEYKANFLESAITGVSADVEGEYTTFGFPLAMETVALFYNKDLLDEMGFEPAETMEELIEQSKQFMEKNPESYGFMIKPGDFYFLHSFLGGYGGYVFGDKNTNPEDIGLNNEGALKAAELMKKIHDEILPLSKEDLTDDVITSFFNEGKLLYYLSGPWAVKGHLDAGVNLGVKVIPTLDNGEVPTPFSGVKAYYVNAYSKYPKAATLLAQFATSEEMLKKRYEMTGQIPPLKALVEDSTAIDNEYNKAFLEQMQYSVPMPNIPEMQNVWGSMETAFTAVWNGESEPKAALDSGVQQIKDAISTQGE